MGKIAFLFPGQGCQAIGMGRQAAQRHDTVATHFHQADNILGFPLSKLCFDGPIEQLTLTENAQPALLTTSVALLPLFREKGIQPDFTAGHSLGEYAALVAAEAMLFEEALVAVRKRGLLMEQAVPAGVGGMAAIIGMEREQVEAVCKEVEETGTVVGPANYNCPGQLVISGEMEGVTWATEKCKEQGARRVIPLSVSGPFHSRLMKPAVKEMAAVLSKCRIMNSRVPIVANASASPQTEAGAIYTSLVDQIASPVRWEESIRRLITEGVDTFIEIGSGNVLTGLMRKIDRTVKAFSVHDEDSFHNMIEKLAR